MPAVLQFLGYDPYLEPKTVSESMQAKRRVAGWSIKEAARQLGVDEGTWGAWEKGETILSRKHREQIVRFLGLPFEEVQRSIADRRNRSHPKK